MSRSFKPETKPTGKPPTNKKLSSKQRKRLEQREAEEATALQRRLKAEFLERDAARKAASA